MYNQGKPRPMNGRPSPVSTGANNGVLPPQANGRAVGLVDRMRSAVPAAATATAAPASRPSLPSQADPRAVAAVSGQRVRPMGFMGALRQRKTI